MPELPEVETIRRDLVAKICHKKVVAVDVVRDKAVRGSAEPLPEAMTGNTIEAIERVGKLLMFHLRRPELYLLVHLKMTGQLIYAKGTKILAGGHSQTPLQTLLAIDPSKSLKAHRETLEWKLPDKHTQIIFHFNDGGVLYFNDMRRFGYARLVTPADKQAIEATYGIEPLTKRFTREALSGVLKRRSAVLKAILLRQDVIAGIGNIYADEICHLAKVLPWRKTDSLTDAEIRALFEASKKIIALAVKERGTTFNNYVDSDGRTGNFVRFLKVYERDGERCLTCKKDLIHKKKIAGRGTHFCPLCQK